MTPATFVLLVSVAEPMEKPEPEVLDTFTVPILIGEAAALTAVKTARAIRESLRDLATATANIIFLLMVSG
jgi:hypothetical protein